MKYSYLIFDVFIPHSSGGNQLAGLPNASGLTTEAMHMIAREFNFAETTFAFPPTDPANNCHVRIFTPKAEVALAGHPTIGAAYALVMQRKNASEDHELTLEEGVGPVAVSVRQTDQGLFGKLTLNYEAKIFGDAPGAKEMAEVLSLSPEVIPSAAFGDVGIPFCLVRLNDRHAVDSARLDRHAWEKILAPSAGPQVFVYSGEITNNGELYARMFAPAFGIEEDPATGSACAALVGIAAAQSGIDEGISISRSPKGCRWEGQV